MYIRTADNSYGTANLADNDHGFGYLHRDDYNAIYWNNEASTQLLSPNGIIEYGSTNKL